MRVSKNEESSLGLVRQNQRGNERAEGGATPPNSNTLGGIRQKQTKHRKSKSGFSVPCFSPGVSEREICLRTVSIQRKTSFHQSKKRQLKVKLI